MKAILVGIPCPSFSSCFNYHFPPPHIQLLCKWNPLSIYEWQFELGNDLAPMKILVSYCGINAKSLKCGSASSWYYPEEKGENGHCVIVCPLCSLSSASKESWSVLLLGYKAGSEVYFRSSLTLSMRKTSEIPFSCNHQLNNPGFVSFEIWH